MRVLRLQFEQQLTFEEARRRYQAQCSCNGADNSELPVHTVRMSSPADKQQTVLQMAPNAPISNSKYR